jgi:hypothetical protein
LASIVLYLRWLRIHAQAMPGLGELERRETPRHDRIPWGLLQNCG